MNRSTRLAFAPLLLLSPLLASARADGLVLRFAGDVTVVRWVIDEANSLGPPDAALTSMLDSESPRSGAEMVLSAFTEEATYSSAGLATLLGVSEALLLTVDAVAVEANRVPDLQTPDTYETSTHTFDDGAGSRGVANVFAGAFDAEIVARPTIPAFAYDTFFGTATPPPAGGVVTYAFLLFDFAAAPGDPIDLLTPGFSWRVRGVGFFPPRTPDPDFFAIVVPAPEPSAAVLAEFAGLGLVALAARRGGATR